MPIKSKNQQIIGKKKLNNTRRGGNRHHRNYINGPIVDKSRIDHTTFGLIESNCYYVKNSDVAPPLMLYNKGLLQTKTGDTTYIITKKIPGSLSTYTLFNPTTRDYYYHIILQDYEFNYEIRKESNDKLGISFNSDLKEQKLLITNISNPLYVYPLDIKRDKYKIKNGDYILEIYVLGNNKFPSKYYIQQTDNATVGIGVLNTPPEEYLIMIIVMAGNTITGNNEGDKFNYTHKYKATPQPQPQPVTEIAMRGNTNITKSPMHTQFNKVMS